MVARLVAIVKAGGMGMTGPTWEAYRFRGRLWKLIELAQLWYMIISRSDNGGGLVCYISVHNLIEEYPNNVLALQSPGVHKTTCSRSEQVKKMLIISISLITIACVSKCVLRSVSR